MYQKNSSPDSVKPEILTSLLAKAAWLTSKKISILSKILSDMRAMAIISLTKKIAPTSIVAGNPTQSYSSKGSLIGLFSTNNDNNARDQFEELTDIMPDLLKLFDIIRRDMPTVYDGNGGKSGALGKAKKGADIPEKNLPFITSQTEENLFFLGETCKRHTNLGVLFPVLFAFRALVGFDPTANKAVWETDPFEFWNTNKSVLVDCVMTKLKHELNLDPQMCGKSAGTYQQLRDRARLLFLDAVREAI